MFIKYVYNTLLRFVNLLRVYGIENCDLNIENSDYRPPYKLYLFNITDIAFKRKTIH